MPICVKTTVTDDPLAGMTPDQIADYVSNVGGTHSRLLTHSFIYSLICPLIYFVGGMCGYPDIVKTFIGLGLNLSLIIFGLFTVSYVVLGIY